MKNLTKVKTALLLMLFIAATAASCKKDNDDEKDKGITGSVTVKAGGYGFDGGNSGKFTSATGSITQVGTVFSVTGVNSTKQSVNISILKVNGTGDYILDAGNAQGNAAFIITDITKAGDAAATYTTQLSGGGGKVTITKLTSTEAEGTFYFTGYNNNDDIGFVEQGTFSGTITKP